MGGSSPSVRTSAAASGLAQGATPPGSGRSRERGAQHHFVVTSDFGIFPATGAAMVRTRVKSEAIAALKDARKSEAFADALKFQVLHPLRGAKMLIMEPVRVGKSVAGGLLEFLAMPGRASKFEGSDREDSVTKSTIGFSYMKRGLAFQFGRTPIRPIRSCRTT